MDVSAKNGQKLLKAIFVRLKRNVRPRNERIHSHILCSSCFFLRMKEMIPMFSDIMTKAISKIFIDPSTTARFLYLVFNLQTSSNDYWNVDHTLGLSFGTTLWKTKELAIFTREYFSRDTLSHFRSIRKLPRNNVHKSF